MTALLTIEPAVIVLLDLYLPDIRGFELLGKFRKIPRVLHFKTSTTYGFWNEKTGLPALADRLYRGLARVL